MKIHLNPFAKHTISKPYHHHPSKLSMFDRTVGRSNQMGIFDYALVAPFLIKLALAASKGKFTILTGIFGALSVPFAIAKIGLYIGTSPLIILAWGIKELVKKEKSKHKISDYTAELNQLMARAAPKLGQDPDHTLMTCLSNIKKLHDVSLKKFSIKANNFGEVVLVRFPSNELVATFEKSRENITAMQQLMGEQNRNRLDYFLANVGKSIFDFSAHTLINDISKAQASNMVNILHKLLVNGSKDNAEHKTSLPDAPKEVRRMIAKHVMLNDIDENKGKTKFFASFTPEEREAAVFEYVSSPSFR